MRTYIKKRLINLISNSQGKKLREHFILPLYARRALQKGVNPVFVSVGKLIAKRRGLNAGLGYISLISRLDKGDYTAVPQLVESYSSVSRNDYLMKSYPNIIDKEVELTGDSTMMKWMVDQELVETDDAVLQNYVTKRIEYAFAARKKTVAEHKRSINHSDALLVLTEIKSLFDGCDKRFFLSSGTLLGAVRDNSFIIGDNDIDLGVFANEVTADECIEIFRGKPFEFLVIKKNFLSLRHTRTGIEIDLFLYAEDDGAMHYGTDIDQWWHTPFQLVPSQFNQLDILIPSNAEHHLTERYGNWSDPVLYFDASYDGPNHVYRNSLESIIYLAARTASDFSKGRRHFADEGAFALRDTFGLDYTRYIPQPLNKSAIPFPVTDHDISSHEMVILFGAFDKFSVENIQLIEDAAKQGDFLVIGMFSDELAYQLNGDQPQMPETERVNISRALACVDNVVLLNTREAITRLIECIKPAIVLGNHDIYAQHPENVLEDDHECNRTKAPSRIR